MMSIVKMAFEVLLSNENTYKVLDGWFGQATANFPFNHKWLELINADLAECELGSLNISLYFNCCERMNDSAMIYGAHSFSGEDLHRSWR